jgi:hypothetical protein
LGQGRLIADFEVSNRTLIPIHPGRMTGAQQTQSPVRGWLTPCNTHHSPQPEKRQGVGYTLDKLYSPLAGIQYFSFEVDFVFIFLLFYVWGRRYIRLLCYWGAATAPLNPRHPRHPRLLVGILVILGSWAKPYKLINSISCGNRTRPYARETGNSQ